MSDVSDFPEAVNVDPGSKYPSLMFFCLKKYPTTMPKKGKLWVAGYYDRSGSGRESFENYRTLPLKADGPSPEQAMDNLKALLHSLKLL